MYVIGICIGYRIVLQSINLFMHEIACMKLKLDEIIPKDCNQYAKELFQIGLCNAIKYHLQHFRANGLSRKQM